MSISLEEAIDSVLNIQTNLNYEIIPIENAQNRIIAEDILAVTNLPKFNNSAMDGYAIIFEDYENELEIIDTIFAGDNNTTLLEKNKCIKIMTGARIPNNCTAIIPKENIEKLNNNNIKILQKVKEYQHIRFIGEDIKLNTILIKKGEELLFSQITLLASQGKTHIKVYKKPKVVVFSSGEELKLHYEKIEEYQIYNSNTPSLISRARELGCDVVFIGQAKDSIESIKELIKNSLDADLIITSGGVSVGDADFTKNAFNQLNFKTIFDSIAIKPGKPTVFGKIDKTFILNLPGNPLACSLVFEVIAKVLIQKLSGSNEVYLNFINSKLKSSFSLKKGRTTIIPGFFDGENFEMSEKRSPGMVSVLSSCNSMIIIDENVEQLSTSNLIKILPINWKFFTNKKKDFLTHE